MDIMQIGTSLAIIVICYLIGMGCKAFEKIKDNLIPVIVCLCGGILGVIGMFVIPDFPAQDVLTAIAVGIASGLASTGANQVVKQVQKLKNTEE